MSVQFISFIILVHLANSQPEEKFYSYGFKGQNDWSIDDTGNGIDTSANSNSCPEGSNSRCWELNAGATASRVTSTVGYHTIRLVIDVQEDGLESSDHCYLGYRSSANTNWQDKRVASQNEGTNNNEQVIVSDTAVYNNRASFVIRIYSSGSGNNDVCYFDNLEVYGIPFTDSPTPVPTPAPTSHPTLVPTLQPTPAPSQNPSLNPTLTPTHIPTSNPTYIPSSIPTYYPTIPTVVPTILPTKDPTFDPTKDPTNDPTNNPTFNPTYGPTMGPTESILEIDFNVPTRRPTLQPVTTTLHLTNDGNIHISEEGNGEKSGINGAMNILMMLAGFLFILCGGIGVFLICKRKRKRKTVSIKKQMPRAIGKVLSDRHSKESTCHIMSAKSASNNESNGFMHTVSIEMSDIGITVGGDTMSNYNKLMHNNSIHTNIIPDDTDSGDGGTEEGLVLNMNGTKGNIKSDEFVVLGDDEQNTGTDTGSCEQSVNDELPELDRVETTGYIEEEDEHNSDDDLLSVVNSVNVNIIAAGTLNENLQNRNKSSATYDDMVLHAETMQ